MRRFIASNKKLLLPFSLVFLLFILPILLTAISPTSYNALAQVLLSLLLTIASVWAGDAVSRSRQDKQATEKWIPAAEMVSNELLTMTASIERMCRARSEANEKLEMFMPDGPQEAPSLAKEIVKMRCGDCSEKMEYLKNHVDNSYRNWDIFISSNCDEQQCSEIHRRLKEREKVLFDAVERDFPQEEQSSKDGLVARKDDLHHRD